MTTAPSNDPPRERLAKLLLALFDASELRRAVRYFDETHKTSLYDSLPEQPVAPNKLAASVASLLSAPQIHLFLDETLAARPRRRADIDEVRALFPRT